MIYVIIGLFALSLVFLVMFLCANARIKNYKAKCNQLEEYNAGLKNELNTLRSVTKIKEEVKNETDKKIDEVLTGDSVSNAINILCKH